MARLTKPSVNVRPVADRYTTPGQRVIEITWPDGAGALVMLHTAPVGTPMLSVYQHDPGVTVSVSPGSGLRCRLRRRPYSAGVLVETTTRPARTRRTAPTIHWQAPHSAAMGDGARAVTVQAGRPACRPYAELNVIADTAAVTCGHCRRRIMCDREVITPS